MNKYESIIIIKPGIDEEGLKAVENKFVALINENGKVAETKYMGLKKLAYEINKNREAHYVLFDFEANPDFIKELERVYRITDEVLKFIVVRKED